jgi:ribosomal protein L11 methylase PrmA
VKKIPGSFRDPAATVYTLENRIIRKINKSGNKKIELFISSKILEESINEKYLIDSWILEDQDLKKKFNCDYLLEHKKIPFISYPYEWSFDQLKEAALHHLDFNIFLIEKNFQLSDATAYNIQFIGSKPVFIDAMSIEKYEEGSNWNGHNQFCEQFLNPLIISSRKNIFYNNWYRGNIEGISNTDTSKILSWYQKFNPTIFFNVILPSYFENNNKTKNISELKLLKNNKKNFNKSSYLWLLKSLKKFISKIYKSNEKTFWKNYDVDNTYSTEQFEIKKNIVRDFIQKNKPKILCDLGCNTGEYSEISINSGSKYVVGFDYDQGALTKSYLRSKEKNLDFLSLYLDATNPSSNIGWKQTERFGLLERCKFDAVIALAFEHHLAIAKNIPLNSLIDWFISIAPKGLIEFVPKEDETVQIMLKFRKDIFSDYTEEIFQNILLKKTKIIKIHNIKNTQRKIYEYEKIL